MNYERHYDTLIARAESRALTGYSEKHHVVPKCMDKASTRTVKLTPEEHYVAHQLLVRMFPGHFGLAQAAVRMTSPRPKNHGPARRNKLYGWLKRALSVARSAKQLGTTLPPEWRANLWSAERRARPTPAGTLNNLSKHRADPDFRDRQRSAAIESNKRRAGQPLSERRIAALARLHASRKGKPFSDLAKANSIASNMARKGKPISAKQRAHLDRVNRANQEAGSAYRLAMKDRISEESVDVEVVA